MRGFSATWLIVGDGETPAIRDGAVVLDADGAIAVVGPRAQIREGYPAVDFEHIEGVITPGLVNAHCHLELGAMRGRVPGGRGFSAWAGGMLELRARLSPETDLEAIDAGVGELLRAGTAAVGDVTNSLAAVGALATAPIVGRICHEVFGLRSESALGSLARARAARAALADWPANLSYALVPHTPFSLHPDVFRAVLDEGRTRGARMTLHLAEHAAERAFLRDGTGPLAAFMRDQGAGDPDWPAPALDPVAYARALGALAQDVIAVHLTDARPKELSVVAEAGAPVVLCPRSNLHIEVCLPPLVDLLAAGVRPGLGTDSLASAATLDVLEEARALRQRFSRVPAHTLVAMATGWGAAALGLADHVGTLCPGRAPGLLAFSSGAARPLDPDAFVLDARDAERRVLAFPASPEPLPS